MNEWRQYERKRLAFEKKWKGKVHKALKAQTAHFISSYTSGTLGSDFYFAEMWALLKELYGDTGRYFAKDTKRRLTKEQTKGLGPNEDWAREINERLMAAGLSLAQKITDRTKQIIIKIITECQEQNLSPDETVKRILAEVPPMNRVRAVTITRTEVGRAANEGKMAGALSLGVELEKVWIAARDARVRRNPTRDQKKGDHWNLHQQAVPFEMPFTNGVHQLMQPGDSKAPASETIRCRCTVIFKTKKDERGDLIRRTYLPIMA